jgi:methylmalonyl-CoA mutase, C-terminal domain
VNRPRIVLAKPGLDGHDRGVKVVALGLRDAGAEVIYLGLRVTPAQLVAAAEAEDADLIGISVLSGAHVPITKQILAAMRDADLDVPLIVGGTIPPADAEVLRELGAAGVFPVGTALPDVVSSVLAIASARAA